MIRVLFHSFCPSERGGLAGGLAGCDVTDPQSLIIINTILFLETIELYYFLHDTNIMMNTPLEYSVFSVCDITG